MALLSVIRRGREQAKDQKAKEAEKAKGDTPKVPYRHIPTHAASDAISGAPNTFRELDRAKILEQHRRRSAMAANGVGMKNMPRRLGSSLSVVSYPAAQATPIISRAESSNSMPVHPRVRASINATYGDYSRGSRGKEREVMPPALNAVTIPVLALDTAEDSSVSDDGLEMKKSTRPGTNRPTHMPRQGSIGSENLHLFPTPPRNDTRQSRGGRSDRKSARIARTRFTEPKPMDLRVFSDDLERDSSSATLASIHNGKSYASSSASETGPVSTAATSLASTPCPSTFVSYFPHEAEKPHEPPASESAAKLSPVVPSPEGSGAASVEDSDEIDKEPDTLSDVTTQLDKPAVTTTAMPAFDQFEKLQTSATVSATPIKASRKRRWSWRRSKLATGGKLITTH